MLVLYGIANCDTVKKARKWLVHEGIDYHFHDYRKAGVDADWLKARIDEFGWQSVVNRKGTTWRKLPEALRNAMDTEGAVQVLLEQPAMIKRPLLGPVSPVNNTYLLGFSAECWQQALLD